MKHKVILLQAFALVIILSLTTFAQRGGGHAVSAGHGHSGSSKGPTIRSGSTSTVRVRGYTKMDGTHVESHRRTKSDDTDLNNWSTKGNVNPDTGKMGTK